jgi:hypothetical protein
VQAQPRTPVAAADGGFTTSTGVAYAGPVRGDTRAGIGRSHFSFEVDLTWVPAGMPARLRLVTRIESG